MKKQSIERQNNSPTPTVEQIHGRLLLMMKELHRVCIDNHITYYMLYGTALGARRHQGFIPWDDDVDIGMPRPDYERFSRLTREKFPDFLELRWYRNTECSPFQFIKLIDNRTTLREVPYADYLEGLFIDIFPLDGVKPNGPFEWLRRRRIWTLHTMVIVNRTTKEWANPLKRIVAAYIKTLDLNKLHSKLEKALTNVSYDDCELTASFLGSWRSRDIVKKRLFGRPTLYPFEDTAFYGPEKMDEYLTVQYGDFMTPPPPEERVFQHNYPYLDLDSPFRAYKKPTITQRSKKQNRQEKSECIDG